MPYSIKTIKKDQLIEVKSVGIITQSESESILEDIISISALEKINKVLYDHTELTNIPPMEAIYAFFDAIPGDLYHAGYIRPGQASIDLKFAEVIAQNKNRKGRLFSAREAAIAWLKMA